jgi:acyl carrier protein
MRTGRRERAPAGLAERTMIERRQILLAALATFAGAGFAHAADDDAQVDRQVAEIFGRHLGVEPGSLKPDDRFLEDLGLDDIDDIAAILTDIEAQFGIDIPVDIATQFDSLGNVIRFVKDVRASKRF